jgi:hypothetical protein
MLVSPNQLQRHEGMQIMSDKRTPKAKATTQQRKDARKAAAWLAARADHNLMQGRSGR